MQSIQLKLNCPLCGIAPAVSYVRFGHDAERHDRLLTGVELGNRQAACRERLLSVFS